MKIKLKDIVNSKEAFEKFMQNDLPVKLSFKLNIIKNDINKNIEAYENTRFKLIKKYGEEIEKNKFEVKKENYDVFFKEINKILNEDIEITGMEKINLNDLINDNVKMSGNDMELVSWLFTL